MRTVFKLITILFVLTAATPAFAKGDLKNFAEYADGTVTVDLDTYTDGPKVVSLVGMKGNSISISFAFDKAEWPKLLQLWTKAKAMSGSSYATAGSLKEVGSSAQCVISFAGGPAVRMTIVDPTAGALTYVLLPDKQSEFDTALRQIGDAATIVN